MKIAEIIGRLEAYHAPLDLNRETWDGVKYGDPDKKCSGITVTCWPSIAVIQKTAVLGHNFLICHEPTFFEGSDETGWLKSNAVYKAKTVLLDKTGVVIYRDHDHVHNDKPDRIFSGLVKKLGWEQYAVDDDGFLPLSKFVMPETSVREIAKHLALVMRINGIRIIGDPDMKVTKVGFSGHFLGSPMDKTLITRIDSDDCELIIPGEIIDWTFGEYIQDAIALGKKKAVLNVGHFNLEEPGMEYMAEWLPNIIGYELPVHFIQSGNSFQWLSF
jgi:putative NIF3 family GTP cyclohydrolase 1 type 2